MEREPGRLTVDSSEGEIDPLEAWFAELEKEVEARFAKGDDADSIINQVGTTRDLIRRKMDLLDRTVEKCLHAKDRDLVEQADDSDNEENMTKDQKMVAAEAWLRQRLCPGPGGKPWPLWTASSELTQYGPGIWLHFRWNLVMGRAFLAMLLLQLPLLWFCINGKAVEGLDDLGTFSDTSSFSGKLASMTIANLGQDNLTIWCKEIDVKNFTTLCGWLDALGALIVLLAAKWFEHVEVLKGKRDTLTLVPTPDDYTVVVNSLPLGLPGGSVQSEPELEASSSQEVYRSALKSHFLGLLSGEVVAPKKGLRVISTDGGYKGRVVSSHGATATVKWDVEGWPQDGVELATLRDVNQLNKLKHWGINPDDFQSITESGPVHQVSLVHDYGGELSKLQREWTDAESHSTKDKQRKKKREFWIRVHENSLLDEKPVIQAFVIFWSPSYKKFIEDEYRFSKMPMAHCVQPRRLRFQGKPIKVDVAENPSDILWNNLDVSVWESWRHCVFSYAAFSLAIAICLLVLSWSKNAAQGALPEPGSCGLNVVCAVNADGSPADQCVCSACGYENVWNDQPAGIYEQCTDWVSAQADAALLSTLSGMLICATNFLGADVITRLSASTRQKTLTLQEHLTVFMTTVLRFLTLGFTTALVNWKASGVNIGGQGFLGLFGNGEYDDTSAEWFVIVGGQIMKVFMMSVLTLPVYVLTPYASGILRWIRRGWLRSWKELKVLYTPPQFSMAVMQATQLGHILAAMMGSSGMPFMTVLLVVAVFCQHWVDKFVLLRGCDVPPMYMAHLAVGMSWWVYFAVWVHSVAAIWILGNSEVFPSRDSAGTASEAKELADSLTGDAVFFGRMVQSAAIPNTLLLLCLSTFFLSRLLAFLLGGKIVADLTLAVSKWCCRGKTAQVAVQQTVDEAEREWDLRQIKHCYDVTELEEFAFLAPGKEDEDFREPGSAKDKFSRALNKQNAVQAMAFRSGTMGDGTAVAAGGAVKLAPASDSRFAGPSQAQPQLEHQAPPGNAASGTIQAGAAPGDASAPMPKPKEKPKKKKVKPAGGAGAGGSSAGSGGAATTGGQDNVKPSAPAPPPGGPEGPPVAPKAKAKRRVKAASDRSHGSSQ